ncbi:hypothetical protein V5799_033587 [Amblyomma americanum]|uniref:Uncharacterized protein n=1 Tax=Amblyomma americanum TaxID=6943 RepID=A0AAQ4DMW2_AMBAM
MRIHYEYSGDQCLRKCEGYPNMISFATWITANATCVTVNVLGLWLFLIFLYLRRIWIDETTPFICALILLFIVMPSVTSTSYERIAFWSQVEMAIPWSTLLVMGAGFALATAMQAVSGLFAHLTFVTTAITMTNSIAPTVFNMTTLPWRGKM